MLTRLASVLLLAVLSFYATRSLAQTPGEIDSTYAVDGMNTFWLEIDGIVHGLQIMDIHLLPNGELLGVGNAKWGCSGTWTIQGIVVRIDNNGFLDSTFFDQGYHILDTPGFVRILPTSDQHYFLVSADHIVKIHEDGTLDADFGEGGYLEADFQQISAEMDNDGNIVVGGRVYNYSPDGSNYDYLMSRFDPDGVLDVNFGVNGLAYPVDTLGSQFFTDIAIDSQGRIVVTGHDYISQNEFNLLVARTLPDGTPDPSFGDDGIFIETYSNRSRGNTIHIDSADNIIIGGNARMTAFGNWGVFLIKFNAIGTIDTTFGDGGFKYKEVPGDGMPVRVHQLADNSLLITGNAYSEFLYMAKFQADGDPDISFGDDGVVTMEAFEYSGSSTDSELIGNSVIICANSFLSDCAQSKWKTVFTKYAVNSSDIEIIANTPDDISICTALPGDTLAFVDLESNLSQIVGAQTGVAVGFFNSQEDAENSINAIENPDSYEIDELSQQIFVRVESISDEDQFGITSFFVHLLLPSEIGSPTPLQVCDDDLDGFAIFDLGSKTDEILGDIENATLSYFATEQAAQSGDTDEQIETLYTNQSVDSDIVWIRVDEPNGCSSVTNLSLLVNPLPQVSLLNDEISLCDLDGDTLETIDLTSETNGFFGSLDTDLFELHFFQSQSDAEQNIASFEFPESFEVEGFNQSIYIGIENISTGCYTPIAEPVEIFLNPLPVDTSSVPDFLLCDTDFDGSESFDLTTRFPDILGNQDPSIYQSLFFTNLEDAIQNSNSIENVDAYLSDAPAQTIYLGILNTETGCYAGGNQSFALSVLIQPQIIQEPETLILPAGSGDDEAVFDLTVNNNLMLGDQNSLNFQFSFFDSAENATNGTNAIENPAVYTNLSNPQTIYVAMYSPDTLCVAYTSFEIVVDIELSIGDGLFGDVINVFPNPAENIFWIEGQDLSISQISIWNLQGKEVYNTEEDLGKIGIDVSHLQAGVYIVFVRSGNYTINKKLVIR